MRYIVNGWCLFCLYVFLCLLQVNNLLVFFGPVLVFCLGTCVSWWMFFCRPIKSFIHSFIYKIYQKKVEMLLDVLSERHSHWGLETSRTSSSLRALAGWTPIKDPLVLWNIALARFGISWPCPDRSAGLQAGLEVSDTAWRRSGAWPWLCCWLPDDSCSGRSSRDDDSSKMLSSSDDESAVRDQWR